MPRKKSKIGWVINGVQVLLAIIGAIIFVLLTTKSVFVEEVYNHRHEP